ncbi:MAG: choice-of-anchor I family protein [Oleispira antarctica]|uniref:Alkaline phosphatase n=1 Tax=Oleispira antarctica RB-8 TaxID=698738 RepID=R4YV61_OLEAN|nr:choice-of-anchor I family protein [Oleispira antarctica]MBQ0791338.1 choice-of-anchor I family protein [Oleispira antarctica]CCK77639.1 alkaline phosphatase [Oleispira antarctica RB-8]|tara:strand:+ start:4424 stop:6334 length:1911 start_codon:yes stop_codon:yes gene_type:complete
MKFKNSILSIAILSAGLTACGGSSSTTDAADNGSKKSSFASLNIQCVDTENTSTVLKKAAISISNEVLTLSVVDSYFSGSDFATSSAEIVSYDTCSDRLYVVNSQAASIDVLALNANNSAPSKVGNIDLSLAATAAGIEIGAANSVSAKQGLVAVAIEAKVKQNPGLIALYRSDDLSLLATYSAGALPDMVTLSSDGQTILTANEGEPSSDYVNDPEGSVTIVDLSEGYSSADAVVKQVSFSAFNIGASRHTELDANVRITGPAGTSVAQDLEPEYLAINSDNTKAYVALQENNAIAIIDIATADIDSIKGLGEKSWNAASGNELDASNKDDGPGEFSSYEQLVGLYMPDTIASFSVDDADYIISANEGDGREYIYSSTQQVCDTQNHSWDGKQYNVGGKNEDADQYANELDDCISFIDEVRGGDIVDFVDASHPLKAALDDNDQLKRIKVVSDKESYSATDNITVFGGRSFSIWNEQAELVFDSGDDIAKKVFASEGDNFNATNDNNDPAETADNRSDDKGTEPEAIEVAEINGKQYAFIGLERQGGIIVYDVTIPTSPVYQSYLNNRDFSEPVCTLVDEGECDNDTYNPAAGDLGPESIDYFTRLGKHFIAVGNEVSGTTTVLEIGFNNSKLLK